MKNSHRISPGALDILYRTNFVKALFSRKTAWFLTAMAGVLLLLFLLRDEFHGPKLSESSQAQPQAQSNPNSPSSRFPISSVPSSSRSAASGADKTQSRHVITSAKPSENDESPVRRWQFGTHWGKEPHPALAAFSGWAQRYVAADPGRRDAMVAQGAELAQRRRAALLELIATDPCEALASSVPFVVRQQLPPSSPHNWSSAFPAKGISSCSRPCRARTRRVTVRPSFGVLSSGTSNSRRTFSARGRINARPRTFPCTASRLTANWR